MGDATTGGTRPRRSDVHTRPSRPRAPDRRVLRARVHLRLDAVRLHRPRHRHQSGEHAARPGDRHAHRRVVPGAGVALRVGPLAASLGRLAVAVPRRARRTRRHAPGDRRRQPPVRRPAAHRRPAERLARGPDAVPGDALLRGPGRGGRLDGVRRADPAPPPRPVGRLRGAGRDARPLARAAGAVRRHERGRVRPRGTRVSS